MPSNPAPFCTLRRLDWTDPHLGSIDCPKGPMELIASFGSGLTRRAGDPPDIVWGIGDRGPNLKVKVARKRYGLGEVRSQPVTA